MLIEKHLGLVVSESLLPIEKTQCAGQWVHMIACNLT